MIVRRSATRQMQYLPPSETRTSALLPVAQPQF